MKRKISNIQIQNSCGKIFYILPILSFFICFYYFTILFLARIWKQKFETYKQSAILKMRNSKNNVTWKDAVPGNTHYHLGSLKFSVKNILVYMSLCSNFHPPVSNTPTTIFWVIYIIQGDYSNIMKHWGLSYCGMAGTEQEMWMEGSGCVKLKGKSREGISLVLPYTFYYYTSVCTFLQLCVTRNSITTQIYQPKAHSLRWSTFTVVSQYHDLLCLWKTASFYYLKLKILLFEWEETSYSSSKRKKEGDNEILKSCLKNTSSHFSLSMAAVILVSNILWLTRKIMVWYYILMLIANILMNFSGFWK